MAPSVHNTSSMSPSVHKTTSMPTKVDIQMTSTSKLPTIGPSSGKSWSFSAFMKLILLTLTIYPSKAADSRDEKNETTTKKSVCHRGYGCFSNESPFNPRIEVLPQGEDELGTKFLLRTRENKQDYEITNKTQISNSTFKPSRKTKVLIHGFKTSKPEIPEWVPTMADVLLSTEDVNVIIVNWVKGALTTYDQAGQNTRMIGAQIHKFILYLIRHHGAKAKDFHLIGFSLGAHVAGFAGKRMNKSNRKLGRISGLDPANPNFNYNSTEVRLDRSDASFVDVIHTATQAVYIPLGLNRALGHIDFWPNGGAAQTGCDITPPDMSFTESIKRHAICDHIRAYKLYTASIENKLPMYGHRCNDYSTFLRGTCFNCRGTYDEKNKQWKNNRCSKMGYFTQPPRGNRKELQINYYLQTSDEKPFVLRPYQVTIHFRKMDGHTTEFGHFAKLFIRLHADYPSDPYQLTNSNMDEYIHMKADTTMRFLINLPAYEDVGNLKKITFWWQRQYCNPYLASCNYEENIFVKRIRIFDVVQQKRYTFITPERLESEPVAPKEILPNDKVDFVLRENQPKHKHSRRGKGRKNSKKIVN